MIKVLPRTRSIYYGWWMAGVGGLILLVTGVPIFHAMTVWAVALAAQFGWNRTQLGFALSLTRVEGSISGPISGYLTDRFGSRVVVFSGLLVLAGGFVFFSQVRNLWMFYLAYFIMSIGQGQAGWLPVMSLLNQWFRRRLSLAVAIAVSIMGLGSLLLVPAIAWAVNPDADRIGWRVTAIIVAGIALASAFVIPKLIRNRPQDYGLLPDGDPPDREADIGQARTARGLAPATGQADTTQDFTTGQALRTSAFWCITFGHGLASMVILAIMSHLGLLMVEDQHFSVQTAAWVVSAYTGTSLVFQMLGGYIGDRVPKNLGLFFFTVIQGVGVLMLVVSSSLAGFYTFAVLFGIGLGGRTPMTTSIRGEYFGRASFGKIFGLSMVPMNVLLFIASPMAGYMRDRQGTYDHAFLTMAILTFIGAVLFLVSKKPRLPARVAYPQPY